MKRFSVLFMASAVLACAFTSCQKESVEDRPCAVGIDIAVSVVASDSFTFTLAPYGECQSYGYAVVEGSVESVDAAALFKGGMAGVSNGSYVYATDKQATVSVSSLSSGMLYTVYAVCGNSEKKTGPVAKLEVTTSDVDAPVLASFSASGNSVELVFSEPVAYKAGSEVTAVPYCKMFLTGQPAGGAVKGEVFAVFGNKASVKFPDITTPGTYYLVNYAAGTFTDLSGNPCEALSSKFTSAVAEDGSCGCEGVYGSLANGELVYKVQDIKEVDLLNYSSTPVSVNVPAGVNRVDLVDGYKTVVEHADGTKSEYPMAKITHYFGGYYDATVKFAGEVVKGDKVSVIIPAGAIQDWYGNVNSKDIVVGPVKVVSSAPEIKSFSSEGNVVTIVFDEDVKLVPGKNVKATPYCKMYLTGNPAGGEVSGEVIEVYGTSVKVKFASFTTPGTYYAVSYDTGTFTDMNDNPCLSLSSKFTSDAKEDGSCGCEGVYGWLPNGELKYTLPAATTVTVAKYSTTSYSVHVDDGVLRIDLVDGYKTVIEHADKTTTEVPMTKITHYYGSYYDAVVKFAGEAVVGDKASIVIPAGAIMDWYGNVNSEPIVFGPVEVVE